MSQNLAAIDLGSNSFHLLVVQDRGDEVLVVDKMRERVRLAAGLTKQNRLRSNARKAALSCLEVFGQRIANIPNHHVRAVGTNTLRKLGRTGLFMEEAEAALGRRIEIISGLEEARLIYLGVSHVLADATETRLVVDIGGGSTECIVGRGPQIQRSDSLFMGCVDMTNSHFATGEFSRDNVSQAIVAARLELGSIHRVYKSFSWSKAYGCSGTIHAVSRVLLAAGRSESGLITAEGVNWLIERLLCAKRIARLSLPGLKAERLPVFAGGVCILAAIFKSLGLKEMQPVGAALREGLVQQLRGAGFDVDLRERTIRRFVGRYAADRHQADRVARVALDIGNQVFKTWDLDAESSRRLLRWASDLHEVGKAINYAGYHRHGAYLVANSDMSGFSRDEQNALATLLLGQRRKLVLSRLMQYGGSRTAELLPMVIIFRLSRRLNRTRSPTPRPELEVTARPCGLHLAFPAGWLLDRPLTTAELVGEAEQLQEVGYTLTWS